MNMGVMCICTIFDYTYIICTRRNENILLTYTSIHLHVVAYIFFMFILELKIVAYSE